MDGVFPIGFYVGNALAGPIKHKFGYLYNFGLGMLMTLLGFFYVAFFLPDSIPIRDQRLKKEAEDKIEELRLAKKFEGKYQLLFEKCKIDKIVENLITQLQRLTRLKLKLPERLLKHLQKKLPKKPKLSRQPKSR